MDSVRSDLHFVMASWIQQYGGKGVPIALWFLREVGVPENPWR
jgi:hypothetical protein